MPRPERPGLAVSKNLARADAGAGIHDANERRLSPEEVAQWLARPIPLEEAESARELVRWFTRRYPTGKDRLAYVRRAYARWVRSAERVRRGGKDE
jgi:hypothetical protein